MKRWGGRFKGRTEAKAEAFTASIPFDHRLYRHDILGSMVHCRMLARQGIVSPEEAENIVAGLKEIAVEIERGEFPFDLALEDIHLNIEARLQEKIGEVAGKLHTARSRNDQIALDMRLFVREATVDSVERLVALQEALLALAQAHQDTVLPGYTHLQRAQPILLAHYWLAYVEMFQRDGERLRDAYQRADIMPLGAGALAGVPYPIDRQWVATELGFSQISQNSLAAVSDRDFVVEYVAAAATTMMHLSRLAEELVLWSSSEFGFVEIDDAYATGSSIMPQKKNPDVAELVRAKTGRVYGHLMGILTMLKGLPLAYNKDLQEDKEGLFDTVDTLLGSLEVMAGMLGTLKVKEGAMRAAASDTLLLATDLADYLVGKGMPFRQAHQVVGALVGWCLEQGKTFPDLTLEDYRRFSPLFDEEVQAISLASSLAKRNVPGGTAPSQVEAAWAAAAKVVEESKAWVRQTSRRLPTLG